MTAKQSAILVQRARKRRTLRDELRARCGVFNDQDGRRAPDGWVEIQRFDTIDREYGSRDATPFESDEHAALAVAEQGGAPGAAMHYETGSGMLEPVEIDGLGCTPERWNVLNARATLFRRPGEPITWITIVPRSVAKAAGLDCEDA